MVVVVETILAEVCNVEIGPAVVVVVSDSYAETPAIVGDAGLLRDVARDLCAGGSESAARALMMLYRYSVESGEVAA